MQVNLEPAAQSRQMRRYILPMELPLACFAACTVGLESIVARELSALAAGRALEVLGAEPGGVEFQADLAALYDANLRLRAASRILVRVGSFHASAFHELERRARRLPWEAFLSPGAAVSTAVTSKKSRLYHQDGVAERLLAAAGERVTGLRAAKQPADEDSRLLVVRVFRDQVTVSADSSGELLHRRGYRLATAKAPLRETLAAAMLLASGWDGSGPLVDPMCGSGTLPIEAALLARRIPPGLHRRFGFQTWPGYDPPLWERRRAAAMDDVLSRAPAPIVGSDRDEGAVGAARENAERAGVGGDIVFRRATISAFEPPAPSGLLITNPPYGRRIGERARLRNLFAQLGNVVRRRAPGWSVAFLSAHAELARQTGLPLESVLETLNGGIRVRLLQGAVAA